MVRRNEVLLRHQITVRIWEIQQRGGRLCGAPYLCGVQRALPLFRARWVRNLVALGAGSECCFLSSHFFGIRGNMEPLSRCSSGQLHVTNVELTPRSFTVDMRERSTFHAPGMGTVVIFHCSGLMRFPALEVLDSMAVSQSNPKICLRTTRLSLDGDTSLGL